MKSSKVILALWLGASAWAQTLPQNQQVTPTVPAKPSGARTVLIHSPKAPASVHTAKTAKVLVAAPYGKHRKGKKAYRPAPARTASAANRERRPDAPRGKRDPFVSPVVERLHNVATCTGSGRKCLAVGEISLYGIVRSPGGSIAVVVNGQHTYFLRENDPLADGDVERITQDAIILRERTSDALGRPLTREVTKKLGVPAV
jgi:Tfp pilus assembly protein PilP